MPPAPPQRRPRLTHTTKKHEGTLEIPNNKVGTPANTNPYVPPYAATALVDVAEASEEKPLIKTCANHNSPQAAEAYDTAATVVDTAGAASASLKEVTSPAE